jgi:hypothetical protein
MAKVEAKPEMKMQEAPRQSRIDERLMKPGKYEVSNEHTFDVEIHLAPVKDRWVISDRPGKGIDTHKVVFRMWNYDEMIDLKRKATSYDSQKRLHMVDNDALNRLKIQKLLVSWTLDSENPRLKLFHVQGVLTDESWQTFAKLQPNIISHIIEEMNRVYEYNG